MIKQLLKRYGYEPIKPPPPLRCASIVVRQEGKLDCPPFNLCENDTLKITYDFTIVSHRNPDSDQCYIYLGKDLLGIIDLDRLTSLDAKRCIDIKWEYEECATLKPQGHGAMR